MQVLWPSSLVVAHYYRIYCIATALLSKLPELRSPIDKAVSLLTFIMVHCRDTRGGRFSAAALLSELSALVSQGLAYPFEQLAIDLRKQESDSAALAGATAEAAEACARTTSGELRSSFGEVSIAFNYSFRSTVTHCGIEQAKMIQRQVIGLLRLSMSLPKSMEP
jgi:hypothetical protein